jgi:hypothetical protein
MQVNELFCGKTCCTYFLLCLADVRFKICVDAICTVSDKCLSVNHHLLEFLFHFVSENSCSKNYVLPNFAHI